MTTVTGRTATATGPVLRTLRFTGFDLRRLIGDWAMLFFSMALPVIFYLVFGAAMGYGSEPFGSGNVKASVMIGMALYAGITGAVAASGNVVVETKTGWGRQLALTPLTTGQRTAATVAGILVRAVLPVLAVFTVGALTGAVMPGGAWVACPLLCVAGAVPFGFYGMIWSLLVATDTSVSIASTSVVILAFLGNVFMPLPEGLLTVGRFTPLYGVSALAHWPLGHGEQTVSFGEGSTTDPLWWALLNIAGWTVVFVTAAIALQHRERGRQ